jgi:hypothetical protein
MILSREQLLGSFERRYRTVDTLAGQVRIRNLTEAEKSDFEAGNLTEEGKLNLKHVKTQRRKLIAAVLVDADGKLLLQPGDVESLKGLDAAVTSAIFHAATEHCGFSGEEKEELAKNFDAAGGDDSPTG